MQIVFDITFGRNVFACFMDRIKNAGTFCVFLQCSTEYSSVTITYVTFLLARHIIDTIANRLYIQH